MGFRKFARVVKTFARPTAKAGMLMSRWGFRGAKNAARLASLAYNGVKKLRGLVNSELYKLDTAWASAAITNGFCSHRTAIQLGDGDDSRTGNSVFVRSYNFKGILSRNAAGANTQTVRVSIIIDTQQVSDTVPTYTDIYESLSPFAHLNSNTVGRYKILFTRTYVLDSVQKDSALVNINLAMRHHVRYNGVNSSDIQKGGIYMCVACDEPSANMPSIAGEHRLSYHDN
ncbi:MAG: capsid protein [Cressdnaviricota sp.]|nr:MAG: capsid protein [Cressdnaviricota sp.]